MVKSILEMSPVEYRLFMKGIGQEVPEHSTTRKQAKQSKAAAFFSQPYGVIMAFKSEHPEEYAEMQRQFDAENEAKSKGLCTAFLEGYLSEK